MFSGEIADSVEHVLPKWLQSYYNLWNQKVRLPNYTSLPYRQLTIPVATKHNAAFSLIEKRISSGSFSQMDAYLWALKIHTGFIYKDSGMKYDRSIPSSKMILEFGNFTQEILLFQLMYNAWCSGDKISPEPFGTVYVMDSNYRDRDFDLFHCLITGVLGITIPHKFLLVFFWDQGDSSRSSSILKWAEHEMRIMKSSRMERETINYMAYHVWACEAAYAAYRQRRPLNLVISSKDVSVQSFTGKAKSKRFDISEYGTICRNFGLKIIGHDYEKGFLYGRRKLQ